MARRYNHVVRYLESWFKDLEDPSKEFTDTERWQVLRAIAQCQFDCSLEPLEALPLSIRRGLSWVTMGEQLLAIMDRADSYKRRANGQISPSGAPNSASKPSDVIKAADREKSRLEAQKARNEHSARVAAETADAKSKGYASKLEQYQAEIRMAVDGDDEMRRQYPNWADTQEAQNYIRQKGGGK